MATIPRIEKVLVSWNEEWNLARYLDRYVFTRRLTERESALAILHDCLVRYPGEPPYRKSDLDYFLDANFMRSPRHPPR
jgi:hypothetical protein